MKISIIGAGLIGKRRAETAKNAGDKVVSVYDTITESSGKLASAIGAKVVASPEEAMADTDVVIICTPNKFLLPMASIAAKAGKHILIEKPMGRNLQEAESFVDLQNRYSKLLIKVGFNHRYHPAIAEAERLYSGGLIGKAKYIRAVYGHGGRPGYENEWRGSKDLSGGGELTDQGVHLLDLTCWMLGVPDWVFAQRRQYSWQLDEGLEDNGFITLGWPNGEIAQLHTSWTQWKNRFSFQLYGTEGALEINGLGGSYGPETLTITKRKQGGGVPDMDDISFPGEDRSWAAEWNDFTNAISSGRLPMSGVAEGLNVMRTLDAVYQSCETITKIHVNKA